MHQEKLKSARVLVIGAGGLGSPLLAYLAAAGVGHIGICEADTLELHNLQRQILYSHFDVGHSKLERIMGHLQQLNPHIRLTGLGSFTAENAVQLCQNVDLIFDAADNFPTRYLINDTCTALGKPWVWGAAQGWEGMASRFDAQLGMRHLFPEPPSNQDDCDTLGVIGPLLGVVSSHMALEGIKHLTDLGDSLYGWLWIFDAFEGQSRKIKISQAQQAGSSD